MPKAQLKRKCVDPPTLSIVGSSHMYGLSKCFGQLVRDIGRPTCDSAGQYSNVQPNAAREEFVEGVLILR